MNWTETGDLLTFIAAVDNRRVGEETVEAWQLILADVDQADAAEAVRNHFATSHAYLMPVHVRDGARTLRVARQRGRELRAVNAPTPAVTDASAGDRATIRALLPQRDPDAALKLVNPTEWAWRRSQRRTTGPAARPIFTALPQHLQEAAS